MSRSAKVLLLAAAVAWALLAIVSIVVWPTRPAAADGVPRDPEARMVTMAAIVSDRTGRGRPTIQHDPRHASANVRRVGCEGADMVVVPSVRSRYAPVIVVGLDGWMLRHGYAVGVPSSQGRRVLVGFTRDGEPIGCREVFSHPEANLHVLGEVIR